MKYEPINYVIKYDSEDREYLKPIPPRFKIHKDASLKDDKRN